MDTPKSPEIKFLAESEIRPFSEPGFRDFFSKFCKSAASLSPIYLPRAEWEKKTQSGIVQGAKKGPRVLFLPEDLEFWEIPQIIEALDFKTNTNSKKQLPETRLAIEQAGQDLENAGVYLAKYADETKSETVELAKNLATDFYKFGSALRHHRPAVDEEWEQIRKQNLNEGQIQQTERWLAGDKLYASRMSRAAIDAKREGKNQADVIDAARRRTVNQYFDSLVRATRLTGRKTRGELRPIDLKDYKVGQNTLSTHFTHLQAADRSIGGRFRRPKQELVRSFMNLGVKQLVDEVRVTREKGWRATANRFFRSHGINFRVEYGRLKERINWKELLHDYEVLKKSGNLQELAKKELEIARLIESGLGDFARHDEAFSPAEILRKREINCVGASLIGSGLLSEIGINHLVVHVPRHSIVLLVTSDERVYWQDMVAPDFNSRLTDDDLAGALPSGKKIAVSDIVEFSRHPAADGLRLFYTNWDLKYKLPGHHKWIGNYMGLNAPDRSLTSQVLNSIGSELNLADQPEAAIEAFKSAQIFDKSDPYPMYNMSESLISLKKLDEAKLALFRCLKINPEFSDCYNRLGSIYISEKLFPQAEQAMRRAIEIEPIEPIYHMDLGDMFLSMGKNKEAINAYKQALAQKKLKNPDLVHCGIGRAYLADKNLNLALKHLNLAVEINPADVHNLFFLAQVYYQQKDFSKAEEYYRKILELEPKTSISAYVNLGAALIEMNRPEEAIKVLKAGEVLEPDLPYFPQSIGEAYYKLGRKVDARHYLEKAVILAEQQNQSDVLEAAKKILAKIKKTSRQGKK